MTIRREWTNVKYELLKEPDGLFTMNNLATNKFTKTCCTMKWNEVERKEKNKKNKKYKPTGENQLLKIVSL